jgi:hypothetical protein
MAEGGPVRRRAAAFVPAFAAAAALAASSGAAAPAGAVEICTGHGPAWIVLPIAREGPLPPAGRKESGGCVHLVCPRIRRRQGQGRPLRLSALPPLPFGPRPG